MGLFSSKYITTVGTSVVRVVEDDSVPQSVKAGAIKALFQEGNVPDYVMEELVASIGVRAERMYRYAETNYTHGLPSGDVYSSTQGRQKVEDTIEQIEGQQVLLEYSHYGPPNTLHMGWMKLVSQYGYNQATNELTVLSVAKGKPVYLKDMVVVVPAAELNTLSPAVLELWGTAANGGYTPERLQGAELAALSKPTAVQTSATATEMYVVVTYVWQTGTGFVKTLNEESLTISVSEYDETAGYFHAKYHVNGQTKYWLYKDNSGTYPILDAVYVESPAVSGSYFPFTYFRYNKAPVNSNTSSPAYLTSEKMMKYLGIDYAEIIDSINENPDIGDVEQAMLTFSVPAVSTNAMECRYLFDYFNNLHYTMSGGTVPELSQVSGRLTGSGLKGNVIVIKDAQFKMALSNNGIYKQLVAGSIGAVGTYTSVYSVTTENQSTVDAETGATSFFPVRVKLHQYRQQVAVGLYEEVTVRDLTMTYYVYGDYTTTGDETDDILLIPIDRSISSQYLISEREELYTRSLHFVFNSRVVTKVKWYQTGVFKALLFIVAVVITIYNPPAGLAALNLTGAALVIAAVVINLVVGFVLQQAFRLFVKAFGAEFAQIVAIIAIIYGGYQLIKSGGSLQGTWASELLQLSNGLQTAALQDMFSDLLAQQDQFNLFVDEQTKLLDDAQKLLETSHVLDPYVIFGEKPEDFYNRTVHFGNIGTLGITAISSYVDIALALPKINDTLGEEIYERT
jgi:hypothetical protein